MAAPQTATNAGPVSLKSWILIGIGVVLFLTQPRQAYPGDPNASRLAAISVITRGSFSVPLELGSAAGDRGQYFFFNEATGRYYSKYGFLNTIGAIPPLLAARLTGDPLDGSFAGRRIVFWLNLWNIALAIALAHYLFGLTSFFSTGIGTRIGLVLLTFFCTYVWNYLRAQSSEILQMLFFTAGTYHLFAWRTAWAADEGRRFAWRHLLAASACLSLLILAKTVYVVLAPVEVVFIAATVFGSASGAGARVVPWRGLVLAFAAPLAVCGLLVLALNSIMFGHPLDCGYTQWENSRNLFSGSVVTGLKCYLVTASRGILPHFPVLLLGLAGIAVVFCRFRAECMFLLGSFAVFLLINAKFLDPGGSWGYGPRYLVFCLPALAAPGVAALDLVVGCRPAIRSALLGIVGAAAAVFLVLQVAVNSLLFMTFFDVEDCFRQFTFYDNPRVARHFHDRHMGVVSLELLAFRRGGVYGPVEEARAIAGKEVAAFVTARVEERVFYNYLLRW